MARGFLGPQQAAWQSVLADFEQQRQKDMVDRANALKMAELERANQMAVQKEDLLKQWLNPPTDIYGAGREPVDVGQFATEYPQGAPGPKGMQPMRWVGAGRMGAVPFEKTKTITQQGPEAEVKRKMAQLKILGIPISEELPEQRAERELEKQKEAETYKSKLEEQRQIGLEKRLQERLATLMPEYVKEQQFQEKMKQAETKMYVETARTLLKNNLDFMTADPEAQAQMVKDMVDQLRGVKPPEETAGGEAGKVAPGTPLDQATAEAILKEAGGDKKKARQIAKQRGYKI